MDRGQIERLLAEERFSQAFAAISSAWRSSGDLTTALYTIAKFERYREKLPLIRRRLFLARSVAVEPVVPLLRACAYVEGIDLEVQLGQFNAYATEISDPQSPLYRFAPDIIILALNTASVAPNLWAPADPSESALRSAAETSSAYLCALLERFRSQSAASVVVHNLDAPPATPLGVLESRFAWSQAEALQHVNARLKKTALALRGVYVLDYDGLVARHGRFPWWDELKWERYRVPISSRYLGAMANEWMRFICPLSSAIAKVAAVDLDNTLWGGIIGEEGMAGIRMGAELSGSPFRALQRALLALRDRGVLLAVCSKNNAQEAMDVLEGHPDMLLRPEHFAAIRVNWDAKSANLLSIAQELNVGIDAVAFIDDNPVERAEVQSAVPAVRIVELPAEALGYAQAVLDFAPFERLERSQEDAMRAELYAQQAQRAQAQSAFHSKESFLESLEQRAQILPVNELSLPRAAQLTQKTNQFNLTTRRYSEAQLARIIADPAYDASTIRVVDRFGDNGIVGVAITRDSEDDCVIDTFLLSCRVLGRGIESALLAHIARRAAARGKRRLLGEYLPTPKNAPAADFFERHGFTCLASNEQGATWHLETAGGVSTPRWIHVTTPDEVSA